MSELQDFQNKIARDLYGITTQDAIKGGICIQCRNKVVDFSFVRPRFDEDFFYTEGGRREYFISGLCEKCFDSIFQDSDRWEPDPESLTCFKCDGRGVCPLVDDPYNTNGDCLANK